MKNDIHAHKCLRYGFAVGERKLTIVNAAPFEIGTRLAQVGDPDDVTRGSQSGDEPRAYEAISTDDQYLHASPSE
jgi:hypothetical protein